MSDTLEFAGLYPIEIDIYKKHKKSVLMASIGDVNGRGILATILNNGVALDTTGVTLRLAFNNYEGVAKMYDFEKVEIEGVYKYKIHYPSELLENQGSKVVLAEIKGFFDDRVISYLPIYIYVYDSLDPLSVPSEEEIDFLVSALGKIDDIDQKYEQAELNRDSLYTIAEAERDAKVDTLETQFSNVVANVTVDSEVIAARGTFAALHDRLNSNDAQLADIENELAEAITPDKTTFVTVSKNIFDKKSVIEGAYISSAGVVTPGISASGLDCHTGYIEVIPGETYHRNKLSNVLMYDENYVLSNTSPTGIGTFTATVWAENFVKYIRMSIKESDLDTFQLELGSEETSYEPYGLKINDLIAEIDVSAFQTELDTVKTDVSALQSLNQDIPEYFQTEILHTVQSVEACTTEPSLVLTLLTDSHSDQLADGYKYIKETANNIAEVNKYIQSDAIVHLGDLVAGTLPLATTKGSIRTVATELRNANIPLFVLRGNHDDNSYGVDATIPNLLLSDGFYPLGTRQTNIYNNVYRNGNSNYGYINYEQHKIRVIMLDAIDYPYAENGEGGLTYNGKNWWGYGTEQILWFGHTALKVEEGWGVVVLSHTPSRASHSLISRSVPYNSNCIEGLLKAFKNGTIYTSNTSGDWGVNDTFDFTLQGQRDVIAYVFGHTHMDLVDTPIDLGYPCVSIANNVPVQIDLASIPVGGVAPTRTIGTVTQDLWSVMVVRKDIRAVFLTRFGAGGDISFNY